MKSILKRTYNIIKFIVEGLFGKWEPWLFCFVVIISIIPVLVTKYFITLDGPAHLYNANLIKELLLGQEPLLNDLFRFNPVPVPNWSAHFFLALFNVFLPAFLSEKLLIILYLTLTPIFFRKVILYFKPENKLTTYFIFPFVHNHLFYFGFFNMSLGITCMFITTWYFLRHSPIRSGKKVVILFLLLLLTFFSHIMLFLITIAILTTISAFVSIRREGCKYGIESLKEFKDRILLVLITSIPLFILAVNYFLRIDSIEKQPRSNLADLFPLITKIRPLLTLCFCDNLLSLTRILFILIVFLILFNIYDTIKRSSNFRDILSTFLIDMPLSKVWLFFWISFMILFFLLPNAILIGDRLLLLMYIFLMIWLAMLRYPRWLQILSLLIVLVLHVQIIFFHSHSIRATSRNILKVESAARLIKPGNMVMTLNYSDNWLYTHITGYLGADRPIAVLENYETALTWFPLRWNEKEYRTGPLSHYLTSNRELSCGFLSEVPDTTIFSLPRNDKSFEPVRYVFRIGNFPEVKDSCLLKTQRILNASYNIIQENDFCTLYELRKTDYTNDK